MEELGFGPEVLQGLPACTHASSLPHHCDRARNVLACESGRDCGSDAEAGTASEGSEASGAATKEVLCPQAEVTSTKRVDVWVIKRRCCFGPV